MERDILSLISSESKKFSKGKRQIARYILENYDKAAFMTANKLGATVGVSESTVVRFAADLGFNGYPAMRKALQEMIRNCLTSVQRIEVSRNILNKQDILSSVLISDIDKIRATLDDIDNDTFNKAVDAIISAKNIYVLGFRSAASLVSFMGYYLNMLFENVKIVNQSSTSEVFEQIMRVSEDDVFISVSFPRYSTRAIKATKYANDMGATIIGITDSKHSPISEVSDIALYAKSDMISFIDSLVAPFSLISALIVAIGSRNEDKLSMNFEHLEQIWSEYEVYEKIDE